MNDAQQMFIVIKLLILFRKHSCTWYIQFIITKHRKAASFQLELGNVWYFLFHLSSEFL